jgi:hypothetical protein
LRAYARSPIDPSGSAAAGTQEADLVLKLDRQVGLGDFDLAHVPLTIPMLASEPQPGEDRRTFVEATLPMGEPDGLVTLRRFYVVPGGLWTPEQDDAGNVLIRHPTFAEICAATPNVTYVSVYATYGSCTRFTLELLTLDDAQRLVDRWCRTWRIEPLGDHHRLGRALIGGGQLEDVPPHD